MLSQTSEYAMRAMVWLARQDSAVFFKTEAIASEIQAPPSYLSKILQSLNKTGLIKSRKGINGGYALNKGASAISLFDVILAVDPTQRIVKCPLGISSHETLCPLHKKLDGVHAEMERLFGNCYLSDLVNDKKISPLCNGHC